MAIDYSQLAISKGLSAALSRHARKVDRAVSLRQAYALVDARDEGISWVSGCYTVPKAADSRQRREHHHLHGRNARPDLRDDPHAIITVSGFEHRLIEDGALVAEGDDARNPIFWHWNRAMVPAGKEPFRLKSKRWSQNER